MALIFLARIPWLMHHAAGSLPVPWYLEPGARVSTVPGLVESRKEIRLLAIWTITDQQRYGWYPHSKGSLP